MTKQSDERVQHQLHRLNDLITALIQQESLKRMAVSEVCKRLAEECNLKDPLLMEREKREKVFTWWWWQWNEEEQTVFVLLNCR